MMWLVLALMLPQDASWVVVTHAETPLESLSAFQLKQVYFGRLDRYRGIHLVALHLREAEPLRQAFELHYLGKPADVENYWLGQKLKGGARQPLEVGDWALVLAYLRRNPGFIGYIPKEREAEAQRQGLKVVAIHP